MYAEDFTKISIALSIVYPLISIMLGRLTYIACSTKIVPNLDNYYFFSEVCLGLGMIGTIVGLLVVFSHGFHDLDLENIDTAKNLIKNIGLGASTALISTLVGLTTSLLVKAQLRLIENEEIEIQ